VRLPASWSLLFPYTTLFRSVEGDAALLVQQRDLHVARVGQPDVHERGDLRALDAQIAVVDVDLHLGDHAPVIFDLLVEEVMQLLDRKSTRLNSSHVAISYAV